MRILATPEPEHGSQGEAREVTWPPGPVAAYLGQPLQCPHRPLNAQDACQPAGMASAALQPHWLLRLPLLSRPSLPLTVNRASPSLIIPNTFLPAGWRRKTSVQPWRTPGSDRQPWRSRLASERCVNSADCLCCPVSHGFAVECCCCACSPAPAAGLPASLHVAWCAEWSWHPWFSWLAAAVQVYQLPQLTCQICLPAQSPQLTMCGSQCRRKRLLCRLSLQPAPQSPSPPHCSGSQTAAESLAASCRVSLSSTCLTSSTLSLAAGLSLASTSWQCSSLHVCWAWGMLARHLLKPKFTQARRCSWFRLAQPLKA